MGALWKFGTPLALASRSLIPPKAPVLGLYPTKEGDGWGSIIKWGTHCLGFEMVPNPPPSYSPLWVLFWAVGYLLLCWVLFN